MDSSEMQKYMSDAKSMFKVYNRLGGRSNFDTYKQHLKLFFFHTLNSHVFVMGSGATVDDAGFMLHESRSAAEAALMHAANIDDAEVSRIFDSVDSVHAYT